MSRGYGGSPEEISWSRSKGNIEISASTERSPLSNPLGRVQGRSPRKGEAEEPTRKRTRCAVCDCFVTLSNKLISVVLKMSKTKDQM